MKRMRRIRDQIARIANRSPLFGPILWILSLQYFIAQLLVAAAWPEPYDWANNYISDLGNTVCAPYQELYVCSPLAPVMNLSFVLFGFSMTLGAVLIYQQFIRTWPSLIGFLLMALAGIGTMLVGIFPENAPGPWHTVGAFLGLGVGNVSLIVLAFALKGIRTGFKWYTVASGLLSLAAFGLFLADIYLGLGRGGMERLVSYPFTVWMIAFGAYMTLVRMRARDEERFVL